MLALLLLITVDACINTGNGYFVFDIIHVKQHEYWPYLKSGIDKYLSTVNKKIKQY
jgi:hypothetical protein